MRRVLVAGALLTLSGLALWLAALAASNDSSARLSDLGSALLGGAVVAFAVLLLEHQFELRAESQALRLAVALQPDLRGANLSDQQLSGTSFGSKDLTRTLFSRAKLRDAGFVRTTLARADFTGRT